MNQHTAEYLYNKVIDIEKQLKQKTQINQKVPIYATWERIVLKLCYSNRYVQDINKMDIQPKVYYYRDEHFPVFLIHNEIENKFFEIDLENEKLNLMKKQIRWIQRSIKSTQEEFITHNSDKDFLLFELKPDDTQALMKDKFDIYKISDQAFLLKILQHFFEVSRIQTKTKCYTIIGFYINSYFEIIIEYRIMDNVLNQNETTKRRHLSQIIESSKQYFGEYEFEALVDQMISSIFIIEQIEFEQQKDIIYEMIQYRDCRDYFQHYHRINDLSREFMGWKIYSIYSLNFSTNKIFGKYKIMIMNNIYKLSFIHHDNFIGSKLAENNIDLLQDYVQLVNENENFLKENRKKKLKQILKPEEVVQKEINKYKCLLNEMLKRQKFEIKIKDVDIKINSLDQLVLQDLLKSSEDQEENQNKQIEYDNLLKQKSTLEHMQIEFSKIIEKCMNLLLNYNSVNSLSQDKHNLQKIYAIAQIEEKRVQQGLPIYIKKSVILEYMKKNQVFLLVGETGSGKSTQLPQYLAEEIIEYGKVLCCQPKALAAKSLAKRVADELGAYYGSLVGYNLGVEQNYNDSSKIIFTQDRILLNIMQNDPLLSEYDAIIIDEAHERTVNIDLLCGMLKNLLIKRPDLKLIITSATVDQLTFCNFFRSDVPPLMSCPALKVEGRIFPVDIKYYPSSLDYINSVENILYSKVLRKISEKKYNGGHVLVFLAGVDEINRMIYKMQKYDDFGKVIYFPLHGQLTYSEQSNTMKDYQQDTIKIIFSTRIAETSLTINDVSLVIDIGQDRVQFYDQKRGMQVTQFDFISQSQAQQRAGRAGRTRPGKCYRLYSETDFQSFPKFKVPEILKTNLDLVVLRIKSFHLNIYDFQFLNKPSANQLYQSECYLIQINALRKYHEIVSITTLGTLMSQLQTEPKHSRILIQAYYKGVLEQVLLIISMMMNSQHLFIKSNNQDLDITNKLYQIDGSGDMMTYLSIAKEYQKISKYDQRFKKDWSRQRGLNYKSLKMSESSYKDIDQAFFFHHQDLNDKQDEYSKDLEMSSKYYSTINASNYEDVNENDAIMKCFLSSYYPTICVYTGHPQIGYHMISNDSILRVYGTSALSLLNHYPKYIICSDLYQSQYDYCKIAQEVPEDLLKIIVPPEFMKIIDTHYQPKYFENRLTSIPLSLIYFLKSKYKNIQTDHNYSQYAQVDLETSSFWLWSSQEIDLTQDIENFKQKCREQVIGRFYGFNIMAYFKQGAEVDSLRLDIDQNFTIVQYNNFPYSVEEIIWFLEQQRIEYDKIFEYGSNYRGQKGEIHFKSYTDARIAQQYFNCLIGDGRYYFVIKQKNIKQRSIVANSEITFFGALCKGIGYVKCLDDIATNNFFVHFSHDLNIQGRQIYLKYNEERDDYQLKNLPTKYDEYQFEKFIRDRCQQCQIEQPKSIRLLYEDQDQSESDYIETLKELSEKYLDQPNPYIFLKTHNNKKFRATITSIRDPLKLDNFRKELNFKDNILGTSLIYIRNEYKLFKLLSTQSLKVVRIQLNIQIDKLQQNYRDLQIIIREGQFQSSSIIIKAQTPNVVRNAAEQLTGLINGYRVETNHNYLLIKQLSKCQDLQYQMSQLEQDYQFHVDRIQLSKGNIIIYTQNDKLQKLTQGILEIIETKIQNNETIRLNAYSLKPLLRNKNNILENIQYKHDVGVEFDIPQKLVTFFGSIDQIKRAKEDLFQELNFESNINSVCSICDDYNGQELFILSLCMHKFCQTCLYKAFVCDAKLPLRCPEYQCNEYISLRDLTLIINEYELDKILNRSFNKFKEQQNFKNCLSPNCQAFFPKEQQFCYCMSCLANFCFKCSNYAHQGKTCEQAKQNIINSSQMSEDEMKELKIKKCPKCKCCVQKNEGCNHIKCKQCDMHFCWECLLSSREEKDIYDHMKEKQHNQ